MKRIFYFTGHRLTVLHWKGSTFAGSYSFEPDSAGLDKFEQYLLSSAKLSTKLLIDVIEEDFRTETVPHVLGKDRKAVVNRLLDRFYRASRHYTHYEIIGRRKSGRKDDEVLLAAVTDPGLIDPWIDVIQRTDTPLSGIWTLPLMSTALLSTLGAKKGPVLLVSQQVSSTLRQTYFRDGRMLSSRQSVINQDASNVSNIGKFARPEILRTTEFLRNQHLISAQEVVQVHILGSSVQADSLQQEIESDETRKVIFHRIEDIHRKLGIKAADTNFSDVLFSKLCLTDAIRASHYGKKSDFKRHYYSLISTGLYAASVIAMLIAAVMTVSNISSAFEASRSVELLNQQEQEYRKVYSKKFEAYEPVFQNARGMNAAVDLVSRIEQHAIVSPLDLYIEVSKILGQAQFKDIEVDKISWSKQQYVEKAGNKASSAKTDIASPDKMKHIAVLEGKIAVSNDDYSRSVTQINNIVLALLKHDRIESVEALEMPVEVRSNKRFAAESGVNEDRLNSTGRGSFSLEIVMRGADHV